MIYEETSDRVLGLIPPRAVKPLPPRATLYDSLDRAKKALAARTMENADVRAWLDLDDLQRNLLKGEL